MVIGHDLLLCRVIHILGIIKGNVHQALRVFLELGPDPVLRVVVLDTEEDLRNKVIVLGNVLLGLRGSRDGSID